MGVPVCGDDDCRSCRISEQEIEAGRNGHDGMYCYDWFVTTTSKVRGNQRFSSGNGQKCVNHCLVAGLATGNRLDHRMRRIRENGRVCSISVQLSRNGVTKVDKLYAGNGTTARKGLHEWVAAMPIGSVVMDAEWRNADDVLRLMAEGVHVNVYDKTTAGYRHCHGREVCFLRCTVDGLSMRYEDAGNGMKLYYDEKEENMGLLSFINYNTGGNFIMMCGNPSPCLYVSVPLR